MKIDLRRNKNIKNPYMSGEIQEKRRKKKYLGKIAGNTESC